MNRSRTGRYYRILRAYFTFSAIAFIQFAGMSAAADPASKIDPVTWIETKSKAQGAKENKGGKNVVPDSLRQRKIAHLRQREN